MAKEIKVFVVDCQQYDADSIAVTLDFDGIAGVPTLKKLVEEKMKVNKQVNIKEVLGISLAIYAENKRRRAKK